MRALRLLEWKSDPVLMEVDDPVPGPQQVVVRIGGAGACSADLHLMREFEGGLLPWGPPFTLGHQNAGWVHALGSGVTDLELGQPVAVYGPWGCGRCARCQLGIRDITPNPAAAPVPMGGGGLGLDGGMAEFMLVPSSRFLVPLPRGSRSRFRGPAHRRRAHPITQCAAARTGWLPGRRPWSSGSEVSGTWPSKISKRRPLHGSSPWTPERQLSPLRPRTVLTPRLCPAVAPPTRSVPPLPAAGPMWSWTSSGQNPPWPSGQRLRGMLGDLTIVGIAGGTLPVSFFSVPYEVSIQTTYWGSRPELIEVLDLAARGLLRPKVTTFTLDTAMDAYTALEAGRLEGRAVIVP